MQPEDNRSKEITAAAQRIITEKVRGLFFRYCREILLLSDDIALEVRTFELRFLGPGGFKVIVSPYRELFLASVGSVSPCEVRVSAADGYISALDLALHHYLEVRGRSTTGNFVA
jgi:hypothetical protein